MCGSFSPTRLVLYVPLIYYLPTYLFLLIIEGMGKLLMQFPRIYSFLLFCQKLSLWRKLISSLGPRGAITLQQYQIQTNKQYYRWSFFASRTQRGSNADEQQREEEAKRAKVCNFFRLYYRRKRCKATKRKPFFSADGILLRLRCSSWKDIRLCIGQEPS